MQEVLTERQREVMRWTAVGKTAFEVGMIVGVTERAVNFHIGRVLSKLGATNKTHAAVMAAVMGIL
jgi:DNA-binding CsgD family transcriptional regulator